MIGRKKIVFADLLQLGNAKDLTVALRPIRPFYLSLSKSRELFGPKKPFVKLRPAYSVKLIFSYVLKGKKNNCKVSCLETPSF